MAKQFLYKIIANIVILSTSTMTTALSSDTSLISSQNQENPYQVTILDQYSDDTFIWAITGNGVAPFNLILQKLLLSSPPQVGDQVLTALPLPVGKAKNCYLVMIDNSRSMKPYWSVVKSVNQQLLNALPPSAWLGVTLFADQINRIQTPSLLTDISQSELLDAITVAEDSQHTQLFYALDQQLEKIDQCPSARKHIILLSDAHAEDDQQAYNIEGVIAQAQKRGITVHGIGFGDVNKRKMRILTRLADQTGGIFKSATASDLGQSFTQLLQTNTIMGMVAVNLRQLPYATDSITIKLEFAPRQEAETNQTETVQGEEPQHVQSTHEGGENLSTGDDEMLIMSLNIPIDPQATRSLANLTNTIKQQYLNYFYAGIALLLFLLLLLFLRLRATKKRNRSEREQRQRYEQRVLEDNEKLAGSIQKLTKNENISDQKAYAQFTNTQSGEQYLLHKDSYTIGSASSNDICLQDPSVSRQHAIFDFKQGKFIWTDRKPINPTLINDTPLKVNQCQIYPGDTVQCGLTLLQFSLIESD